MKEPKRSLSLSLSLSCMEASSMLFFPTLVTQQSLFLTSYPCVLLGKYFLDIILILHPGHCQTCCCLCQIKSSGASQFYLSCQTYRAKDFGFCWCIGFHLTQCPKMYYKNFSPSQPLGLEPHAIFHSTQLQFLHRFLFAFIGPPLLQALAAYTLLWTAYWAGCYPEAHIINFVDTQL